MIREGKCFSCRLDRKMHEKHFLFLFKPPRKFPLHIKKQPSGSSSKRAANAQCIRLPAAFRGKLLGKSGAQAGRNKTSDNK